jgi:hypothetical protein
VADLAISSLAPSLIHVFGYLYFYVLQEKASAKYCVKYPNGWDDQVYFFSAAWPPPVVGRPMKILK